MKTSALEIAPAYPQSIHATHGRTADTNRRSLYKAGGVGRGCGYDVRGDAGVRAHMSGLKSPIWARRPSAWRAGA